MSGTDRFLKLHEMGYDVESKQQPVIIKMEEAMRKKNITSMKLCKKTGISRQTMNIVLNGKMKPGIDFALKVSKVLEVPVEELFELHDSAWETLVMENTQSMYWDLAKEVLIERKHIKVIEEREGVQYWDVANERLIHSDDYQTILEKELEDRMEEETEKARNIPVGRKSLRVFESMAKEAITQDVESRYLPRFQRVVKSLRPVT